MGKFEDIINENAVNRLQEVMMHFFQQPLPQEIATRISKNPKRYLLQQMEPVDTESKFTFDKQAAKLRPDQLGQAGFGRRSMVRSVGESINEAATPDTIQQFAKSIGLKPLKPEVAEQAAKKWPEFVEAVKTKLGWDYGIQYQPAPEQPAPEQPAPEQPAPEQPAPEQPAPEQQPLPVNPVGKSLFRRGIEAAGRGLKGLGSSIAGAALQQDPYNPNVNRDPFGDLGVSKMKFSQNPGKVDSKEIDERLGHIEAKMATLPGEDQLKLKDIHDKLLDNWIKVKPALVSYPEKNQEWKNYIQNQLTELEKGVGIQPSSATSGANVYSQPAQSTEQEPQSSSVRA
jgi:hypothetical protein